MPRYHTLGKVPHKRHTVFKKENGDIHYEELFGTIGFDGMSSLLYHLQRPTMVKSIKPAYSVAPEIAVDKNLKAYLMKGFDVPSINDHLESRISLMLNNDLNILLSSPKNLELITPNEMKFEVNSGNQDEKIYSGMIITYKVSPLLNLKMDWVTEITQVKKNNLFVDEQRLGPYKLWHHQHIFEDKGEYVVMKDIVTYIPPFGFLGTIANYFLINKKLKYIFDYRFNIMDKMFNK
jgi:ligand-binding SRPBCC domain-containing protein